MRQASDLRASQQELATHLYESNGTIAALKMGSGKTAAALTAIVELLRDGHIRHAVIMAPKRVARFTWPDEIAAWAHTAGLRYAVLKDGPDKRKAQLLTAPKRDLTIIGLDLAQWFVAEVSKLSPDNVLFDLLVIDEISKLRTPKGKRTKAMKHAGPKFGVKWGLTGSPRPKSLLNLFAPLRLVTDGRIWGNAYDKWKKAHFYPTDYQARDWKPLPGHEAIVMQEAARYMFAQEPPDMPPFVVVPDYVELPGAARNQYRDMERKLFAELDGERKVLAGSRGVAMGKLAQIANGYLYGAGNDDVTALHDEKYNWLADLIEDMDGEPLLIVYEFVEDLRMVREMLGDDVPYLGQGVSDRKSAEYIERWNRGELPCMAMHPASAGHGLNIQFGGSVQAWMSPCWDAELWEQTIARLARPGQANSVTVRVCMAKDTVDEMKLARVEGRLSEQEAFEQYLRSRKGV